MKIIVDCETKPNLELLSIFTDNITAPKTYKDKAKINEYILNKIKEAKSKMTVDTDFAKIFCIGVKPEDEEPIVFRTLQEFADYLYLLDDYELVTFNGKKFDLPLIIKNGLKQGLKLPYKELKAMCKRYQNYKHYDLMEIIGGEKPKKLDAYLHIYCGIAKKEIDFDTCTDEELIAHNIEDLVNTEKLYKVFKPII